MGNRKIANGAYRCRYAPFLVSIYAPPFTFSVLAARDHISQRERQGGALKYCERPESGDNALYLPHLGASLGNEGMGFPPLIPGFSRKMRGFLPPFPNITYIL